MPATCFPLIWDHSHACVRLHVRVRLLPFTILTHSPQGTLGFLEVYGSDARAGHQGEKKNGKFQMCLLHDPIFKIIINL